MIAFCCKLMQTSILSYVAVSNNIIVAYFMFMYLIGVSIAADHDGEERVV